MKAVDDALRRVPRLFVLLAALTLGIALAPWLPLPPLLLWVSASATLLAALLLTPRAPAGVALVLFACPFLLSGAAGARQATAPAPNDIAQSAGGPSVWVGGTVISEVEVRAGTHGQAVWTATLAAQSVDTGEGPARTVGGRLSVMARDSRPPSPGDTVWLRGRVELPQGQTNPDGFDYRAFLARRGIHATLTARRAEDAHVATRRQGGSPLAAAADALRTAVPRLTRAHLPPDEAALLDGLLLSLRGGLSADLTDAFARTGTIHVLSVSGLHLAALAGMLAWLFGRLPLPRRVANILSIVLLWVFVAAAGGGPAATRSALMATVLLLAPLLRRAADPLHSWAFAATVILVADPLALYDAGFQLSFGTVGVLLLYMPPLTRWLLPWEPYLTGRARAMCWLLTGVLGSLVAEAGSGPLAAYHFNLVSLVAPAANLLIAPLTELLLMGGMIAVAASVAVPWATLPLWICLHGGICLLRWLAFSFAAVPFAAVSVVSPPAGAVILYYAALAGIAPFVRRRLLRKAFVGRRLPPP